MASPIDTVKAQVRRLRAYTLSPHRATVKINQNENPWPTPARIMQETMGRLTGRTWSRYPDFVPLRLHECLAAHAGWRPDGVLAGNGSNELIQALLMVTVSRGKRVLISEPTFTLYRQITSVLDGQVISVALTEALAFDSAALLRAVRENSPEVTIICSPNNPTGCLLADDDLRALLKISSGFVV